MSGHATSFPGLNRPHLDELKNDTSILHPGRSRNETDIVRIRTAESQKRALSG
jgi:hypothetical protein